MEVLKKEILEEAGVKKVNLLINGIFGLSIQIVKPHIKNGKYVSAHLHYDIQFLFEASENDILKIKQDENSDVRWLDIDTVLDKVTEEHMKPLYEKLMNKVKKLLK